MNKWKVWIYIVSGNGILPRRTEEFTLEANGLDEAIRKGQALVTLDSNERFCGSGAQRAD